MDQQSSKVLKRAEGGGSKTDRHATRPNCPPLDSPPTGREGLGAKVTVTTVCVFRLVKLFYCVWTLFSICEVQILAQTAPATQIGSSTKVQFDRGKQLLEQRKFAAAAAQFKETLKSVPNSPLLYNLLGFCELQLSHVDDAVTHFKKALELKPDFKAARNNLGGIYLMQGRTQQAIGQFSAIIQTDPNDAQAYSNLARAELAQKNPEDALDHLRKAHDLSPQDVQIALALARLCLEMGRQDLGRPVARGLSGAKTPDASKELEIGGLLLGYKLEEAAHVRFRNALEANPKVQDTLFALAKDLFEKQNYRAAVPLLEILNIKMQQSAAWHEMLGYSAFKLGDSVKAVVELQKAMDLDPRNENYILELSEVFVSNNNAAAAVTLLETATKAFAHSSRMWFGLGTAYLADQQRGSAELALKKSLELDPSLDLAYVVLGQSYKEAGNWDQLSETAERLIQLNPKNPDGYHYKALALQSGSGSKAEDEVKIEKLLRKSLELDSNNAEPHYELAKLLMRTGNKESSLLELQKLVQTNPDFGPAYYQLARLYREKGDLNKSKEAQEVHERIRQKERDKVMKRMIVEIRQR
jgi:tetratricopeptide (TPR) repeat protein